jgi:hypothetical protein
MHTLSELVGHQIQRAKTSAGRVGVRGARVRGLYANGKVSSWIGRLPRRPLQLACAAFKLLGSSLPPRESGTRWSTTAGSRGSRNGMRHNQHSLAPASTAARICR